MADPKGPLSEVLNDRILVAEMRRDHRNLWWLRFASIGLANTREMKALDADTNENYEKVVGNSHAGIHGRRVILGDPIVGEGRKNGHFFVVAEPLFADPEMLLAAPGERWLGVSWSLKEVDLVASAFEGVRRHRTELDGSIRFAGHYLQHHSHQYRRPTDRYEVDSVGYDRGATAR